MKKALPCHQRTKEQVQPQDPPEDDDDEEESDDYAEADDGTGQGGDALVQLNQTPPSVLANAVVNDIASPPDSSGRKGNLLCG